MNGYRLSFMFSFWLLPLLTVAQVRELPSPAGQGSGQPNLAVSPDGRVHLSWIERLDDGRFSLRFSTLEKDRWSAPRIIAEGSNWFVNWADFPSMVVLPDGSLRPVFRDGWQLNGCPVNGPAIAAAGRRLAVAWFTGANNASRVKLAFSTDAGKSFSEPVMVDDGSTVGRVDVLLLADGSAMVCWLEKLPGSGEVRVRRIRPDGNRDQTITVAPSGTSRSNGFPQMVRAGETLVFAWTGSRVLTATMPLP